MRASRRWPRCCTSARRARCRGCTSRRRARRPSRCASARAGHAARGRCRAWRRSSRPTCCRTAATPSRCAPTAPARAAGAAHRRHALARRRPARRATAASSTCAGTGSRAPVSLTQHPAPDRGRALPQQLPRRPRLLRRRLVRAARPTTTVWVSPEDDIEFRRVELHNLRRADARPRADVVVRGDAGRRRAPTRRIRRSRTCSCSAEWQAAPPGAGVRAQAPPGHRQGRARGPLPRRGRAGADRRCGCRSTAQRWLGRNRDASHPLAAFDEPPVAPEGSDERAARHRPRSGGGVRGAAADRARRQGARSPSAPPPPTTAATLRAVIDKYRQPSHVERASLMSATLTGIRLREMRINAETFAAIQTLTTALALTLTRAAPARRAEAARGLRPAPALALRHLRRPADRPRLGRRRRRASACCARWRRRCASGRGAASPATWSSSTTSRRRT